MDEILKQVKQIIDENKELKAREKQLQQENAEILKALEESTEELENCYGRETPATERLRDLADKVRGEER